MLNLNQDKILEAQHNHAVVKALFASKIITQKYIREYKRMAKKNWHDKEWHDFMGSKKSEAVSEALYEAELDGYASDIKYVQKLANKYFYYHDV